MCRLDELRRAEAPLIYCVRIFGAALAAHCEWCCRIIRNGAGLALLGALHTLSLLCCCVRDVSSHATRARVSVEDTSATCTHLVRI